MAESTPAELAKEEAVVRGLLTFTIGDTERTVPELKWRANREWQALLQATFAKLTAYQIDTPDGLAAMADAERELVLAYDSTHVLGDLEDATEREIDVIYNGLVTVAFPLATSQSAMLLAIVRAASASASSTNGPSPTGTSAAPTILRDHSPSAKSGSSTRKRKSA